MQSMFSNHHRFIGSIAAVGAFVIAAIYLFVTPEISVTASWLTRAILLYGHSLCWFLLCVASILWAVKYKNKWSVRLAYVALGSYVLFMATLLFT